LEIAFLLFWHRTRDMKNVESMHMQSNRGILVFHKTLCSFQSHILIFLLSLFFFLSHLVRQ
jgi:hypothetical protein